MGMRDAGLGRVVGWGWLPLGSGGNNVVVVVAKAVVGEHDL